MIWRDHTGDYFDKILSPQKITTDALLLVERGQVENLLAIVSNLFINSLYLSRRDEVKDFYECLTAIQYSPGPFESCLGS